MLVILPTNRSPERTAQQPLRFSRRTLLAGVAGVSLATLLPLVPATTARANDFGPPWLGIIVVERAVTHTRPTLDSMPIGPLRQGSRVPVTGEVRGGAGPDGDTGWYQTTVGYLPASTIREFHQPWVGEIASAGVNARSGANSGNVIWRRFQEGDLVRVTGISPGIGGDRGMWWATTEGWVPFSAIRDTANPEALNWVLPSADEATNGWWGAIASSANVRVGTTTKAPIVGVLEAGKRVKVLAEEVGEDVGGKATWYRIDGGRYAGARVHSSLVRRIAAPPASATMPRVPPENGTWIVVNRRSSTLTLAQNGAPVFATYVSLGNAASETPNGQYATFGKYKFHDMTSTSVENPRRPYDIPNVPSTMYFKQGGFAIHGTYWHDDYGLPHSEGCINLTITDGAYVFEQTQPTVPADVNARWSSANAATPVLIVG
jgi:lipoprotein-anchoring transpeptidase ErfK/SrfK